MINGQSVIAMIPARMGSTRLRRKNLALLNGKPLIYYAIETAKLSGVFDRVVVNSEHPAFAQIAGKNGVEFYQRPEALGGSSIKSDDVVIDFMRHNPCDITAWVNSTSPLQTSEEVKNVVSYFCEENLDSLITVKDEQVHCLYDGQPLNFEKNEVFAQTQDLIPVQRFVYSIMMWRNNTFIEHYEKHGQAILCGTTGYFSVNKMSSLIVKTEEDLRLIEDILIGQEHNKDYHVRYEDFSGTQEEL